MAKNHVKISTSKKRIAQVMAASMAVSSIVAVLPGAAVAAPVGNATILATGPADESSHQTVSRIETKVTVAAGNTVTSVGIYIKRTSDDLYLQTDNSWDAAKPAALNLSASSGDVWTLDLDAAQQAAIEAVDDTYEVEFEAVDSDGSSTATTTKTTAFAIDHAAPNLVRQAADGRALLLMFNEELQEEPGPEPGNFAVKINGTMATVSDAYPIGNSVLLEIEEMILKTDTITVSYTVGSLPIKDKAGNEAAGFADLAVENKTPGEFAATPTFDFQMKAAYTLQADDPIATFTPSADGADMVLVHFPYDGSNKSQMAPGNITAADFEITDNDAGTTIAVGAVSPNYDATTGSPLIGFTLASGSLEAGKSYTLKMSAASGGNEITLPGSPTTAAEARLSISAIADAPFSIDAKYMSGLTFTYDAPSLAADTSDNDTASGIEISFTDDLEWRSKITAVKVDGSALSVGDYTVESGKITILAGKLGAVGNHTVTVEATGYATATVVQEIVAVAVDKSTLATAITAAQSKHDTAAEGSAPGQYASGSKALLQTAIAAAVAVRDEATATQDQVNDAVTALNAAVTTFEAGKVVETVDKTVLSSAITTAQSKHDAAVEGTLPGQYASGSKALLQTAIAAAVAVRDEATATQDQVNDAVTALNAAVTTFEAGKVAAADKAALNTAITAAQSKHDAAVEGTLPGQYASGSKAALQAAIAAAVAVRDNATATQDQANDAVTALNAAVTTFESSKVVQSLPPAAGDITVRNNATGDDTVTVTNVAANATVKVYDAATGGTEIGAATQGSAAGALTIHIVGGINVSTVYVSIKEPGKAESVRTSKAVPSPEKSFVITGSLTGSAQITATATVTRTAAADHSGDEVVIFQLMKGTEPVSIVALQKDITSSEVLTAHFNAPKTSEYFVKIYVLSGFSSDPSTVGVSLADAKILP